MNEPKPNPGEGWRLLEPSEFIAHGDEAFTISGKWVPTLHSGPARNLGHYRRRIPAPADGWLDAATVKVPVATKAVHLARLGNKIVSWWLWNPSLNNAAILVCGFTHWQPAIVPDPPKAPEPVKSAEEVGFEQALKLLAIDKHGAADKRLKDGWDAALYWRKANP